MESYNATKEIRSRSGHPKTGVGVGSGVDVGATVGMGVEVGITVGVGVWARVTVGARMGADPGVAAGLNLSEHPVSIAAKSITASTVIVAICFDIVALLRDPALRAGENEYAHPICERTSQIRYRVCVTEM
ncbi:MAG: hypothetical protein F4X20_05260 [Dehalococcoidia bacterium]|nr:hypothetical protein [Dehalococcoidia bacterium]